MDSSQNKRSSPSTPTSQNKKAKTRGQTYQRDELIAMIDCVITHHTFNIGEKMKAINPKFPTTRTTEDYARALRSKFSQFRKKLLEATNSIKIDDEVVLMKNQKGVAIGKIVKLSGSDRLTIHGVAYPPGVDSVEVDRVYGCGDENTELLIPTEEIENLGEAIGSIIPWKHDQLRGYVENDDTLQAAWVRYMEDEHVLTIDTSSAPTTTEEASSVVEQNAQQHNNNNRYADNVLRNANISSEQARNWINYAGNQKEMAETLKMYQEVLLAAKDAIVEIKGGVVGKKEKLIFIEIPGIEMKFRRKVISYNDLKTVVTGLLIDQGSQPTIYTMVYDDEVYSLSMNSEEDFDSAPTTITVKVVLP